MSELYKKKSYSIDMTEDAKTELSRFSKRMKLPQGDAIAYLLDSFHKNHENTQHATITNAKLQILIEQQNKLSLIIQSQNELLMTQQRLLEDK